MNTAPTTTARRNGNFRANNASSQGVAKVAQNVRRLAAALARGERWARELGRGDLFDGAAVAAERLHGYVRGSAENRLFVFAALDVLEERFPKGVPTDAEMRIGATR